MSCRHKLANLVVCWFTTALEDKAIAVVLKLPASRQGNQKEVVHLNDAEPPQSPVTRR